MDKRLIKICGIQDPDTAVQAVMAGANLIGLVFHPASVRNVNPHKAVAIATVVRLAGATPVAVFVDQTAAEMQEICEATQINTVQLHGLMSRSQHHHLPQNYQRIYVQNVSDSGQIETDVGLQFLEKKRDLLLIDHKNPGKGKAIARHNFHYSLPFPWILAGGLTALNVREAIADLNPNGLDVSSGVESIRGIKDILLIQQFVLAVRVYDESR